MAPHFRLDFPPGRAALELAETLLCSSADELKQNRRDTGNASASLYGTLIVRIRPRRTFNNAESPSHVTFLTYLRINLIDMKLLDN